MFGLTCRDRNASAVKVVGPHPQKKSGARATRFRHLVATPESAEIA